MPLRGILFNKFVKVEPQNSARARLGVFDINPEGIFQFIVDGTHFVSDECGVERATHLIEKLAFVFGNEGQGVSKAVQEASDGYLRIEMDGFESLNVAVAAGIVMYHYQRKS